MNQLWKNSGQVLPYEVGALLYCPGNHKTIADEVAEERFSKPYSLALCLEDAISDDAVLEAEEQVVQTLHRIAAAMQQEPFYLPRIFVRVREQGQLSRICRRLGDDKGILTGFIFPKFSAANQDSYVEELMECCGRLQHKWYMMPILESEDMISLSSRYQTLDAVHKKLDETKGHVLNIRVGGNDFCKSFGIRRHVDERIYDIGCISRILSDIAACFARDYVVSAPVWEYFGKPGGAWEKGLSNELKYDKLNGFLGKTVIHPTQISVVNRFLQVTWEDYQDARKIFELADNSRVLVEKSAGGDRMNEYKTHEVWARKTIALAMIYGVREKCERKIIPLSM